MFALIATLIPSLTMGWLSYVQNSRVMTEKVSEELRVASSQASRELDIWIKQRIYELRVFSSSYEVSENLQKSRGGRVNPDALQRLNAYIKSVSEKFHDYEELLVINPDGQIVTSSAENPSEARLPGNWLLRARAGDSIMGEAYPDDASGQTVVRIAVPIKSADDQLLGFRLTIAVFAALSIAIFWYTFATTRERVRPSGHGSSVRKDVSTLVRNVSWLVLVACGILVVIGLVARFASIVFYLKYYVGDDGEQIFLIFDRTAFLTSMGLIGQLVGALITPWLAARYEKHHLLLSMNLLHAVLLSFCYAIPPEHYPLLVALHALGILTFGVSITLLFSMYTDCAEYGEWRTGRNTAGLTVSASLFSLKFGSAVGGALPGYILAAFGFIANEAQTDNSIWGIRLMFNVLPAVFFLAGGLLMLFYRIDRVTLFTVEQELHERRAEAPS